MVVSPWIFGLRAKMISVTAFFLNPVHQGLDRKLIRTDAIERRDNAAQYMVGSAELLGAFNGNHIPDGFHHADHILPAHGIGTDGTDIRIGHIMAAMAETDILPHFDKDLPKSPCSGRILFK